MRFSTAAARPADAMIAALLAIVILCAQWGGLTHRIVHAGLQQQASMPGIDASAGIDKAIEHSCMLLDAAALGAGLATPSYMPGMLPGAKVLALWSAFASWDAPLFCQFLSRAPPRA